MNENGGPDSVIGSTHSTSFNVTGLIADTNYCFRIEAALSGTATSTSNSICITPDLPIAPLFSYIKKVTVASENTITVEAYVDTAADIYSYRLYRAYSPGGPFYPSTVINATANPIISFTDNPMTDRTYYYKIASLDSCGNSKIYSQVSQSVYLNCYANDDYSNTLNWNDYTLWDAGVSSYVIQRSTDIDYAWRTIATVDTGSGNRYVDIINSTQSAVGKFCYRVVAIEDFGNMYGFRDTVYSNEMCVQQTPVFFIPSAFRPGGVNRVFKPEATFVNFDSYHLKIYSRTGQLMFDTTKFLEGWDGKFSGRECEEGVYVYHIYARGGDGGDIKRTGSVILVR